MNKEKQIEEMAKLIDGSECPSEKCPKMDKEQVKAFGACNIHRAQILYNAGYGNVKQAVKEFAEKLKEKVEKAEEEIVPKGCDHYFKNGAMCCQSIIFLILDDLVKEVCGEK